MKKNESYNTKKKNPTIRKIKESGNIRKKKIKKVHMSPLCHRRI